MDERLPFVDKSIIKHLKEVYDNRELLVLTKAVAPAEAIGFMKGVQEVVNRLEAIATREDD